MTSSQDLEMLRVFQSELRGCQKPQCKNLSGANVEEILRDVHRAIFGNGDIKGLVWKMAEMTALLHGVNKKQESCRGEVLSHFAEHKAKRERKEKGIVSFALNHRFLCFAFGILIFFGASSLWSILLQERSVNKIEEVVLRSVLPHIDTMLTRKMEGKK